MSEKLAEVYEQYEMEILSTKKGRGATILTTTDGLRILEPFRGSVTRLEQEYVLKQLFQEEGCSNLDYLIPNKEGMLFTCDKYRQPFVLKKHFEGTECDMHNIGDIVRAVQAMADFHIYGKKVAPQFREAWLKNRQEKEERRIEEIERAIADGEEMEKIAFVYEISQSALEETLKRIQKEAEIRKKEEQRAATESEKNRKQGKEFKGEDLNPKVQKKTENREEEIAGDANADVGIAAGANADVEIADTFYRHNKELKKIQRFVSKVKRKNTFENLFLQVFENYYKQGLECSKMFSEIEEEAQEVSAKNVYLNHYGICHGAYNHHNVILGADGEAIVHFERFSKGNQLNDLYQFARKVMEKNHFDFEMLKILFDTYGKRIPLTKDDYYYMYILFSYPEKFWKIANGYYNANKAFLSPKYVEKLEMVILQENEKRSMLDKYYAFHLC